MLVHLFTFHVKPRIFFFWFQEHVWWASDSSGSRSITFPGEHRHFYNAWHLGRSHDSFRAASSDVDGCALLPGLPFPAWLNHFPSVGCLGCFQGWAIMNSASINIFVQIAFLFLGGMIPKVGLSDQRVWTILWFYQTLGEWDQFTVPPTPYKEISPPWLV